MTNVVFQKAFDQSPSNLSSSDQFLCNFLQASEPLSPPYTRIVLGKPRDAPADDRIYLFLY